MQKLWGGDDIPDETMHHTGYPGHNHERVKQENKSNLRHRSAIHLVQVAQHQTGDHTEHMGSSDVTWSTHSENIRKQTIISEKFT
jgi:hypothetical protein